MANDPKNYKTRRKARWRRGEPLTEEDLALLQPTKKFAMLHGHSPWHFEVPNVSELVERFRTWQDVLFAAGLPYYSEPEQVIFRQMNKGQLTPFALYDDEILETASKEGFSAAEIISTSEIAFDASFRTFCAENLCGNYGANYSCPPACGAPDEMKDSICAYDRALVLQSKLKIRDYGDAAAIKRAQRKHNAAMLRVVLRMHENGTDGLIVGASCCLLCKHCAILQSEPCRFPTRRYSCLSAYCINVKKLAECCGMEYNCSDGKLALFSLYAFSD